MVTPTAPLKIVFQGELGANSHIACLEAYPDAVPMPCPTFEDALNAVASGEADLGMIPIENSVAGRVADIHHLMPGAGLHIIGEQFLPIRNQLLVLKGVDVSESSRSRATSWRSGSAATTSASSASSRGGRRHRRRRPRGGRARRPQLRGDRLAAGGRDLRPRHRSRRTSRTRPTTPRASWCSRATQGWAPRGNGPVLTTFVFQVRNIPAALYKALGGFATNGVNMTKLESYMLEGTFAATQFYSDVEGHPDDPNLKLALEELAFFSQPDSLSPRRLPGPSVPQDDRPGQAVRRQPGIENWTET